MIGIAVIVAVYVACSVLLLAYGLQCYVLTFLYLRKRDEKLAYHQTKLSWFDGVTDDAKFPRSLRSCRCTTKSPSPSV